MRRRDGLRRRLRLSDEGRPVSRTEVVRSINLNQKLMDDTAPVFYEFLVDAGLLDPDGSCPGSQFAAG
ncbi:hypothetical protein BKH13_02335 [Actinomyces naeslundii]|uniref:Uncharacterized protein n=1 Tax=Actinomyces naeslundii TaxID=1655 RepID=A0ABX3F2E3_ACTNA|nr:hypothetical protein BKH13_02335 [Actinomyces naeslundii]OLO86007.1 hypothetical protein BKH11_07405 [Actinomyces naeslundii]OMG08475.1 hypothetical protein BKH08_11060 [Actinomyces naeslundii]